jgi:hypothetical protein
MLDRGNRLADSKPLECVILASTVTSSLAVLPDLQEHKIGSKRRGKKLFMLINMF